MIHGIILEAQRSFIKRIILPREYINLLFLAFEAPIGIIDGLCSSTLPYKYSKARIEFAMCGGPHCHVSTALGPFRIEYRLVLISREMPRPTIKPSFDRCVGTQFPWPLETQACILQLHTMHGRVRSLILDEQETGCGIIIAFSDVQTASPILLFRRPRVLVRARPVKYICKLSD